MSIGMVRPSRLGAWLIAGLLTSYAFWAMGQDDGQDERWQAQNRQIQDGFQKLGKQLNQLNQNRSQTDQTLIRQGLGFQKQMSAIEQGQAQLDLQLSLLQTESRQQIERLQTTNRQLSWALWGMFGLTVMMLVLLWRLRVKHPVPQVLSPAAAGTTSPALVPTTQVPSDAPDVAPESATDFADVAVTASEPQDEFPSESAPTPMAPAPAVLSAAPTSSSSVSPAWAALVAADLSNTEQALAQAREGFMRPVRTEH